MIKPIITSLLIFILWSGVAQDKVILTNNDTLKLKILKYDDRQIDYQLLGETFTSTLFNGYVNSIVLESGRTITPSLPERERFNPVFGKYKGVSRISYGKEIYGMRRIGEGVYKFKTPHDMDSHLEIAGQMMGASLILVPAKPSFDVTDEIVGAEFYSFIDPSREFLSDNLVGHSFELTSLNDHTINQFLFIDDLQAKTINHNLTFTMDGKILENDKEAGTYKIQGNLVSIVYMYTNKKGKLKDWKGLYKVGSYDGDLILLYSTNNTYSYFQNIVLKKH